MWVKASNLQNSLRKLAFLLAPFHTWENWGSKPVLTSPGLQVSSWPVWALNPGSLTLQSLYLASSPACCNSCSVRGCYGFIINLVCPTYKMVTSSSIYTLSPKKISSAPQRPIPPQYSLPWIQAGLWPIEYGGRDSVWHPERRHKKSYSFLLVWRCCCAARSLGHTDRARVGSLPAASAELPAAASCGRESSRMSSPVKPSEEPSPGRLQRPPAVTPWTYRILRVDNKVLFWATESWGESVGSNGSPECPFCSPALCEGSRMP